jgi:NitT/TauT family transport system substrate-binding protein
MVREDLMARKTPTRRRFMRTAGQFMVLSTGLGARAAFSETKSAPPLQKASVRLEWLVYGAHAPWFVGLEKGTFAKHGLDLTVNPGRGSVLTAQVVAAGQETFGIVDSSVMPQLVPQGADLRMFYGYIQKSALGVMFFKDSGIKSPRDLEGKRYADSAGSASNALFPLFAKAAGADPSRIKPVSVSREARLPTFIARQFESTSCTVTDDFVMLRNDGHDVDAFSYSDFGLNLLAHGIVAKGSTLQNSPELVQSLVRGFVEALRITEQDPAEAAQIIRKRAPNSPDPKVMTTTIIETLKRAATANSQGKPPGFMAEADWRATVDVLGQAGLVKAQDANVATFFTNDFVLK